MVCEGILDRLDSQYGSADNVDWIKMVVLETEKIETTRLGRRVKSAHLGITPQQFSSIVADISAYDASIELSTWAGDGRVLGDAPPTDGARGTRALGRL
jgi:hypothetical protein